MSSVAVEQDLAPRLRGDLVICEDSTDGMFVIKDTVLVQYFQVGEQEHFLFTQLDGQRSDEQIRAAFEARFLEPLAVDDLKEFVVLAEQRGLLQRDARRAGEPGSDGKIESPPTVRRKVTRKQSLIHFRVPFFDPDRLLNRMEPWLHFVWTRGFMGASLGLIFSAAMIAYVNRAQFISSFPDAITWKTVVCVWLTIFAATMLHEFAHGLTCKHYGGEVHEIGFLLLFFMPCMYCNVSDAWLFRERSKRLWVGLAGTYCDLVIWALATIVWRVTLCETGVNYFAWMLATVCGSRCFFNFNPLIKLDGYYLLSDLMRVPNLADRGRSRWLKTIRWLLWGARRPKAESHGTFLLVYGLASWLFIGILLWGLVLGLLRLCGQGVVNLGPVGIGLSFLMTFVVAKNMFRGFSAGEVSKMFAKRRGRILLWAVFLIGGAALAMIPVRDRASGSFCVRPSTRAEVNALEAGFLRDIVLEEGSKVLHGTPIARIEIPDLEMNLTKKQAEIRESEANLRRLEAGPRPEEVVEQRLRVERADAWLALGRQNLERARQSLQEEIVQLEQQILQNEAEREYSQITLAHAEKLHDQKALSGEQLSSERMKSRIASLRLDYARAQKRSREAEGTVVAETELARREKELGDEQSKLKLLEAGGRLEEVEAERARLARLIEERTYLERMRTRIVLKSPVSGVITTPRMKEKNGQYVPMGTVVCIVEDSSDVSVEILIPELSVLSVQPGQLVELRARAIPLRTFQANVERKAPSANVLLGQSQGTVTVYCRLSQLDTQLLSGMTGYARIYRERRPVGAVLFDRLIKYLRTEFWWW